MLIEKRGGVLLGHEIKLDPCVHPECTDRFLETDFEMDFDLTPSRGQNLTTRDCRELYYTISVVMSGIILFATFPIITLVFVKLLNQLCKTRSFIPAKFFLLQINFTNMFLFISYLLIFMNVVHGTQVPLTAFLFFHIPSITARPFFLLATSAIFYLAIVHPTTYMTFKLFSHWEWLTATLGWLYALAIAVAAVIFKIDSYLIVYIILHITVLPFLFFCVTMLWALCFSGPGNSRQTLNSTKRNAFKLILSNLLAMLVYYLFQVCFLTYGIAAQTDLQGFQCSVVWTITLLPMISDFTLPAIYLYSSAKIGV